MAQDKCGRQQEARLSMADFENVFISTIASFLWSKKETQLPFSTPEHAVSWFSHLPTCQVNLLKENGGFDHWPLSGQHIALKQLLA